MSPLNVLYYAAAVLAVYGLAHHIRNNLRGGHR